MNRLIFKRPENVFLFFASAWLLFGACQEFYDIAWGTGNWLGQFSPNWALAVFLFVLLCVLGLIAVWSVLWSPQNLARTFARLASLRAGIWSVRWILISLLLIFPVYLLQYTFWGKVLHGTYLRILITAISVILLGWLLTTEPGKFLGWRGFVTALLLTSSVYVFFFPLAQVTSYPFSLGWSEGNRLWDYSVLFGRRLYDYPADKPISAYLDIGRQFVGGIPFLIPGLTIWQERLWIALVNVIPYLILGWSAYRLTNKNGLRWALAGIWAFTFVKQGPIHPPLLLSAILVAMAWGRSLWIAIPLVAAASYLAVVSRFTWMFAPGLWAGMLEFSGAAAQNARLNRNTWLRALSIGMVGILGGYAGPFFVSAVAQWIKEIAGQSSGSGDISGVTLGYIESSISAQPLLWYRLLPNSTYGPGILVGLAFATLPLITILVYLAKTRRWSLNRWQQLAILLPLLAFLVVGLIVSAKIGGGGDLHNMDMFIIGLMFAGAIAWRRYGYQWIDAGGAMPVWIRIMVIALIACPGYGALINMAPISINADIRTVAVLADITPMDPLPNPLPDTLPSAQDTNNALDIIKQEVARAAPQGEILFMDQRQLLTFGYIRGVPLVPEYDKKVLIDLALSEDAAYFANFYRDLAAHRFSLIISSPLHERIQTDAEVFGEENNAWVKWVSTPVLCYYQPVRILKKVTVEILAPREDTADCARMLP